MMIYYLRSDNRIALHPLKIVILEIFHFIAAPFSSLCFFFVSLIGKNPNVHIISIQLPGMCERGDRKAV